MNKPKLLLTREFPEAAMSVLSSFSDVTIVNLADDSPLPVDADILLCTAVDDISTETIARLPQTLGLIASLGVGTNHIDLTRAAARNILVSNTPVVTDDTADLTWALLLAACRRLTVCEQLLRDEQWAAAQVQLGARVHGKTLGIIGMGAIGQAVAKRAKGFDMKILYTGPNPKTDAEKELGVIYCDMDTLLAEADIVSLHCPLTDSSRHLIDVRALSAMKDGAILINTGRGPLIDEQALVEALASGKLGGAGLDVFEFEPKVTPALKEFNNVTLLPHIGSATGECRADMFKRGLGNIQSYLTHGTVIDAVAPKP